MWKSEKYVLRDYTNIIHKSTKINFW